MEIEKKLGIPPELETKVEEFALGFLRRGRKNWDEPHTRAVVFYAGEIAKSADLDVLVLTTTAWLHDIGYRGLFNGDESKSFEQVMDKKEAHMINGAKLAKEFLDRPEISGYYTKDQKEEIIHLVSVHDKVEELTTGNELAFMEADTLGAIDTGKVSSTFGKEDGREYVEGELLRRRYSRFATETGIQFFNNLFPTFVKQFV
jgi:putative nucleotidyltransferase with HDIG domain